MTLPIRIHLAMVYCARFFLSLKISHQEAHNWRLTPERASVTTTFFRRSTGGMGEVYLAEDTAPAQGGDQATPRRNDAGHCASIVSLAETDDGREPMEANQGSL